LYAQFAVPALGVYISYLLYATTKQQKKNPGESAAGSLAGCTFQKMALAIRREHDPKL
jgi:hypothetical protein